MIRPVPHVGRHLAHTASACLVAAGLLAGAVALPVALMGAGTLLGAALAGLVLVPMYARMQADALLAVDDLRGELRALRAARRASRRVERAALDLAPILDEPDGDILGLAEAVGYVGRHATDAPTGVIPAARPRLYVVAGAR